MSEPVLVIGKNPDGTDVCSFMQQYLTTPQVQEMIEDSLTGYSTTDQVNELIVAALAAQ